MVSFHRRRCRRRRCCRRRRPSSSSCRRSAGADDAWLRRWRSGRSQRHGVDEERGADPVCASDPQHSRTRARWSLEVDQVPVPARVGDERPSRAGGLRRPERSALGAVKDRRSGGGGPRPLTHAANVYAVEGSTATPRSPASYAAPPAEVWRVTRACSDRAPADAVPVVGMTRVPVPNPYQPRADVSKPAWIECRETSRWSAARLTREAVPCFAGFAPSVVLANPAKRRAAAAKEESEVRDRRGGGCAYSLHRRVEPRSAITRSREHRPPGSAGAGCSDGADQRLHAGGIELAAGALASSRTAASLLIRFR